MARWNSWIDFITDPETQADLRRSVDDPKYLAPETALQFAQEQGFNIPKHISANSLTPEYMAQTKAMEETPGSDRMAVGIGKTFVNIGRGLVEPFVSKDTANQWNADTQYDTAISEDPRAHIGSVLGDVAALAAGGSVLESIPLVESGTEAYKLWRNSNRFKTLLDIGKNAAEFGTYEGIKLPSQDETRLGNAGAGVLGGGLMTAGFKGLGRVLNTAGASVLEKLGLQATPPEPFTPGQVSDLENLTFAQENPIKMPNGEEKELPIYGSQLKSNSPLSKIFKFMNYALSYVPALGSRGKLEEQNRLIQDKLGQWIGDFSDWKPEVNRNKFMEGLNPATQDYVENALGFEPSYAQDSSGKDLLDASGMKVKQGWNWPKGLKLTPTIQRNISILDNIIGKYENNKEYGDVLYNNFRKALDPEKFNSIDLPSTYSEAQEMLNDFKTRIIDDPDISETFKRQMKKLSENASNPEVTKFTVQDTINLNKSVSGLIGAEEDRVARTGAGKEFLGRLVGLKKAIDSDMKLNLSDESYNALQEANKYWAKKVAIFTDYTSEFGTAIRDVINKRYAIDDAGGIFWKADAPATAIMAKKYSTDTGLDIALRQDLEETLKNNIKKGILDGSGFIQALKDKLGSTVETLPVKQQDFIRGMLNFIEQTDTGKNLLWAEQPRRWLTSATLGAGVVTPLLWSVNKWGAGTKGAAATAAIIALGKLSESEVGRKFIQASADVTPGSKAAEVLYENIGNYLKAQASNSAKKYIPTKSISIGVEETPDKLE